MKAEALEAIRTNTEREWVGRAKALRPMLEFAAARIEQAKKMPPDVLDALHNAEMFRMMTPRSVGGAELNLATYAQVVAAIAEGDASTAWCIAQISGSSMCAAYLEPMWRKKSSETQILHSRGDLRARLCRAVPVRVAGS